MKQKIVLFYFALSILSFVFALIGCGGGGSSSGGSSTTSVPPTATCKNGEYDCEGGLGGSGIKKCVNGAWVHVLDCTCKVNVGDPRKPPYATSCESITQYTACSYAGVSCVKCVDGQNCVYY
jgi:hypothetical protein